MPGTSGFRLHNLQEECERIIDAPNICLETARTGEHYCLANFHTDTYYRISSAVAVGYNREKFDRLLIGKMHDRGMDLMAVRTLVVTGIDAGLLAGTFQHFEDFREDVRITYTHEYNGELVLRDESVFGRDEGVLIVHAVAVNFNGVGRALRLVRELPSQPNIVGFTVLLDRSPVGSKWRDKFIAYPHVIGIHRAIEAYAGWIDCPSCRNDVHLRDVREAA